MRKMKLRNTLLGASLLSLLSSPALAEDIQERDTEYTSLSNVETFRLVHEKAKSVSPETWQKEIFGYAGAVIILYDTSCPKTQQDEILNKNMEIVYLKLVDKFDDVQVNNLPLKFLVYDTCGRDFIAIDYMGKNKRYTPRPISGLETHMYLNGREIDRRRGGPKDINKTEGNVAAMSAWIESNLLNKSYISSNEEEKKVVFRGQFDPILEPYIQP